MNPRESYNAPITIPSNVDQWYHQRFMRNSWIGNMLTPIIGSPLGNPKIFNALRGCPAYQFAAIDAWRRSMWHAGGLPRRTREAIAVAVSVANQCLY
ncbi:MAG: carboxymuconolactone decarboxylase family protein [Pirellula sp.]